MLIVWKMIEIFMSYEKWMLRLTLCIKMTVVDHTLTAKHTAPISMLAAAVRCQAACSCALRASVKSVRAILSSRALRTVSLSNMFMRSVNSLATYVFV